MKPDLAKEMESRFCECGCAEECHDCHEYDPVSRTSRPCEGLPTFLVPCPCKDFKEAVPSHRLYGTDPGD